jgi:hypothetical protein
LRELKTSAEFTESLRSPHGAPTHFPCTRGRIAAVENIVDRTGVTFSAAIYLAAFLALK